MEMTNKRSMSSIEEVVINDLDILLGMAKNCPHDGGKCPLLYRLFAIKRALKIIEGKAEMAITPEFLEVLKYRHKESEGFRAVPYQDTEGVWTFGHGFTRIEKDEADVVLQMKLLKIIEGDLPIFAEEIGSLNEKRLMIFIEMIYQLGVAGVKKFKKFRKAILVDDWLECKAQMLDSRWHVQTTNRCEKLAKEFERG